MRKKKNFIKRNSGFIVGCVVAAGASFATANLAMTDMISLVKPGEEASETTTEAGLEPEKTTTRVYETDAFTVTASGNVIKGIEEVPESETKETDAEGNPVSTGETDAEGNPVGTEETDAEGNPISSIGDDSSSDGSWDGSYSDGSSDGSWDGSYSDGSSDGSWDGSYSDGSSDGSWDGSYSDGSSSGSSAGSPSIEIQDPGNGDYIYDDSSDSSGSSGGSGESAWTPDDVIISGISSRYMDVSELYPYGSSTIRLIRNEIFALHGRMFRSQDLIDYFSQKSWYVPTYDPDEFDANMFYYLNDYEEANLQLILDYEAWLAEN